MEQQPVQGLMKTAMESIKNMIDVNTVVGDAVEVKDGTVVVPVSRISFAFVAGGGEFNNKTQNNGNVNTAASTQNGEQKVPFAGGSGAGVTVSPIGFLATNQGQLRMLPVNYSSTIDRLIDMVPNVIENVEQYISKRSDKHHEDSHITSDFQ